MTDDTICTDCDGIGITKQTERRCWCQPQMTKELLYKVRCGVFIDSCHDEHIATAVNDLQARKICDALNLENIPIHLSQKSYDELAEKIMSLQERLMFAECDSRRLHKEKIDLMEKYVWITKL